MKILLRGMLTGLLTLQLTLFSCHQPEPGAAGQLDTSGYHLQEIWRMGEGARSTILHESALFEEEMRNERPPPDSWVLEGPGNAEFRSDGLELNNRNAQGDSGHVTLWYHRQFPENFLLQFDLVPEDADNGLAIVLFAARSRSGEDIFAPDLPGRNGIFKRYHSGALDCYHVSYWANHAREGRTRQSSNLRKNFGFALLAIGADHITGRGEGPHRVRLLKYGGEITLEVNGVIALHGRDESPYGAGHIGFRQMAYTRRAIYSNIVMWAVAAEAGKEFQ